MKWIEAYATGVHRIDEQHKMLFRMAEDFGAALNDGAGARVYDSFLHSLNLYASSHFRFEEGCMDRCKCPAAGMNRDAHASFIEFAAQFRERYDANGFDVVEARHLAEAIESWLADHICKIDLQLRDALYGATRRQPPPRE